MITVKSLSLRTKLIVTVVFLCILIALFTAAIFYFTFLHFTKQKLKTDLTEEVQTFAEIVDTSEGGIVLKPSNEWVESEHIRDSDHSRYVVIMDKTFKTIRKTDNMGYREFQTYYNFQPVSKLTEFEMTIDSSKFLGILYPIKTGGYIISAANLDEIEYYTFIFNEVFSFSLIVVIGCSIAVAYAMAIRITKPLKVIRSTAAKIDF